MTAEEAALDSEALVMYSPPGMVPGSRDPAYAQTFRCCIPGVRSLREED